MALKTHLDMLMVLARITKTTTPTEEVSMSVVAELMSTLPTYGGEGNGSITFRQLQIVLALTFSSLSSALCLLQDMKIVSIKSEHGINISVTLPFVTTNTIECDVSLTTFTRIEDAFISLTRSFNESTEYFKQNDLPKSNTSFLAR